MLENVTGGEDMRKCVWMGGAGEGDGEDIKGERAYQGFVGGEKS